MLVVFLLNSAAIMFMFFSEINFKLNIESMCAATLLKKSFAATHINIH